MNTARISVNLLGQSGCRLGIGDTIVYVDPYLSNAVQELDNPDLERLQPVPFTPESVTDATWILITHDHLDHCDPHTLPGMAKASPQAKIIAPSNAKDLLTEWGIDKNRILLAEEAWMQLDQHVVVRPIPAAHPTVERNSLGFLRAVGYLLRINEQCLYLAGDTSVSQEVIDYLLELGPIHTAFLPVNESNFFRHRQGIIGNMTVREAMLLAQGLGVKQLVPVHYDMFACNSVSPDEIALVYKQLSPGFRLMMQPTVITLGPSNVSIIIRTLNEAEHLDELLTTIEQQQSRGLNPEVILVDSGSTDRTLEIAQRHGCRILSIKRSEFSFGRSLNLGCDAATGDILVFISGHCVPTDHLWLSKLCAPLLDGRADYVYGGQIGGNTTRLSEERIFAKYFPSQSHISTTDFYCNNANSAISRDSWQKYRFDEELTGLEDMDLAQRIVRDGGMIGYVAEACVVHHHLESWRTVRRRFEREAIALQKIMPQIHVGLSDMLRYFTTSVLKDCAFTFANDGQKGRIGEIICYRWNQYMGTYLGNRKLRRLSHTEKEKYFYPI